MTFHDIQLPDDVEQGATGGPEFQTSILPMSSGTEQRNVNWQEVRHSYQLSYGIQNAEDFAVCRSFFFARRGKAHTFRFKDWGDFFAVDEVQGIGDAVNTSFQLIKTYETAGPLPYIRRITRPVAATVVFKVNNVVTSASANPLGIYTISPAPALDAVVTASFEFDVPVRFDTDKFDLVLTQADAGAIGSLPVIEVRE